MSNNIPGGYPSSDPHQHQHPHQHPHPHSPPTLLPQDHSMVDASAVNTSHTSRGIAPAGEDVPMEEDNPPPPPDKDQPGSKRAATRVNRVQLVHNTEQYAKDKAVEAIREKKLVAQQLEQTRLELASQKSLKRQKLYWEQQQEQWRQEQLSAMNEQWNAHVGNWEAGMESRQQQLDRVWKEQLEQHKDATWNEMNGHMRATLAAREEELKAERQREREAIEREAARIQADYETNMAAFNARFSTQRLDPRRAEAEWARFPEGPPPIRAEFQSRAAREERQLDGMIRDREGRFPVVAMAEPGPSAGTPAPGPSAGTPAPGTDGIQGNLIDLDDPRLFNMVKALIEGKSRTDGVTKATSPKKKKRIQKPGVAAEYEQAKKTQQALLTAQEDKDWKQITLVYWRGAYGLNRAKDWVNYNGANDQTKLSCAAGLVQAELSSKFYFGCGWATCQWNKQILYHIVNDICRRRNLDPNSYAVPDVKQGYLMALLYGHLKDARSEWSRHQPRGGETVEEARERARVYDEQRRGRVVGNSRKQQKFEKRVNIVQKMVGISAAKCNAVGVECWSWLLHEFLASLSVAGMSSEESEIEDVEVRGVMQTEVVHIIKSHPWRAQKRIRTDDPTESYPSPGLPRAMYDTAWLSAQRAMIPNIEDELDVDERQFTMKEVIEQTN
ncbi:hypothetical protein C8F04DRAFT_1280644 [Mycena alexandri]|uniref:Uncharacterized protein n=1 Tax=Mycena alexandri TaxID=1745969 RepID=A0AAD6RWT7_9AGAR|nr:hypothetical protein C8F04DRAFT_1280644 [Mycena alexandri]